MNKKSSLEWRWSDEYVDYAEAECFMEARVAKIHAGTAAECIWFLEHPALVTRGARSKGADLLQPTRFPVVETRRGGQLTYHGPGQRVVYVMLDLRQRGRDIRQFVWALEEWLIRAFWQFGLRVVRREGRIGLWVVDGSRERKIAAVGLRIRKWVSFHGFSVNVEPDLEHFEAIVPCGLDRGKFGVTSMLEEGYAITLHDFDLALQGTFDEVFGYPTGNMD